MEEELRQAQEIKKDRDDLIDYWIDFYNQRCNIDQGMMKLIKEISHSAYILWHAEGQRYERVTTKRRFTLIPNR